MNADKKVFFNRKVEIFDLESLQFDDEGELKICHIENALIRIPGYSNPVDIGSWCYTKHRESSRELRQKSNYISHVDPISFRGNRCFAVREFVSYLALLNDQSTAPYTLKSIIGGFRQFVDWCDLNMPHGIDNKELINNTFKEYSLHLRELVWLEKLRQNTAAVYQKVLLRALVSIFDDREGAITQGVVHLSILNAATNVTECPAEDDAAEALRVSLCLFLQLSDFTLSNQSFPYQLELPNSKYWFFPNQMPFLSGTQQQGRSELQRYLAYDYSAGKVRTVGEISSLATNRGQASRRFAERSRMRALRMIKVANSDHYHERRIFAASIAADSFFNLMAANTGMNASNICRIPWDAEYLSVQNAAGFKTLKPRAGNKETEFVVSSGFMKHFKKYIKLRQFILEAHGESDFPFLFFRCSNGRLTAQDGKFSFEFNRKINRNFGLNISVTTRHWRVLKSDWLIRYTDIATAAMVLQNTVGTVLKHYAEGSPSVAAQEMTNYFRHYKSHLIAEANKASHKLPAGSCADYGNPRPVDQASPIESDCASSEGCIACEHYRVHADTADLTKLFSFKYVLEVSLSLVHDNIQYERLISPTIQKIAKIIDVIVDSASIKDGDVRDAYNAVFEREELSPYWAKKLDLLTRLEVL